jgi:hypothetical protein
MCVLRLAAEFSMTGTRLSKYREQSPSWAAIVCSARNSMQFTVHETSIPFLYQPAIGPGSEPGESNPLLCIIYLTCHVIVFNTGLNILEISPTESTLIHTMNMHNISVTP